MKRRFRWLSNFRLTNLQIFRLPILLFYLTTVEPFLWDLWHILWKAFTQKKWHNQKVDNQSPRDVSFCFTPFFPFPFFDLRQVLLTKVVYFVSVRGLQHKATMISSERICKWKKKKTKLCLTKNKPPKTDSKMNDFVDVFWRKTQ